MTAHSETDPFELMELYADRGFCLALVFDDDGRWAVSDTGTSPLPDSENGHTKRTVIASIVEPEQWKPTIREAITAFHNTHPLPEAE